MSTRRFAANDGVRGRGDDACDDPGWTRPEPDNDDRQIAEQDRIMSLIAEDLLLLLLDDKTGRPLVDGTKLSRVLAGAVLLELALPGAVRVAEKSGQVRTGRLIAEKAAVPVDLLTDPIVMSALDLIERKPITPKRAVQKLERGLRAQVLDRLSDKRLVRREQGRVLGLFPTTNWPSTDPGYEDALRRPLGQALLDGAAPQDRTVAIISLLAAVDAAHKQFPDADRRAIRKRAKKIAEGEWAGKAVRQAVDSVNAAIMAAVVVSSTAATSGS